MLDTKVRPYEFMVFPTVQKVWIEGRGLMIWLALFFVELGASLFLVSTFFNCLWGQTAGWLISAILGGGCHFLFLGHPFRAYRAVKRPGSAWISRGLIIIFLFQVIALIHLLLAYFAGPLVWLIVVADIFAVAAIAYGGYELADVKPIMTWHCSYLPIQMFARSFFLAFAIMLVVYALMGAETIALGLKVNKWLDIALIVNIALFLSYLASLSFEEGKHRLALDMMLKGNLRTMFWCWVVLGGIIIPLVVIIISLIIGVGSTPAVLFLIAVVLQFIADPLLRYCMMRSGYYRGLFPVKPVDFSAA